MDRANVIVHMYTSIDGKIDGDWMEYAGCKYSNKYYDDTIFQLGKANANGTNTIANITNNASIDLSKYKADGIEYEDWIPNVQSETWEISYDRKGRAGWKTNYFEYAERKNRVIEVVTKLAPKEFLAYLRSLEIPYIVCGESEINFTESLVKIKKYFGVDKVVLSGGALINGAFLKEGLIDEISMVVCPYISGESNVKGSFDTQHLLVNQKFKVTQTKVLDDGGIHLIYTKS